MWWGIGAGVLGSLGVGLFYAGLAAGAMSLVAPLSACGAIVPVAVALSGGERLAALTVVGMALALAGAVLVSRTTTGHLRLTPKVIAMAVSAAGLAFGDRHHDVPAGRPGRRRREHDRGPGGAGGVARGDGGRGPRDADVPRPAPTRGSVPLLVGVGLGDTGANVLLTLASGGGEDALVAVLASLYPVVTVVLAGVVLRERLSAWQAAGVAAALAGVALVSAA